MFVSQVPGHLRINVSWFNNTTGAQNFVTHPLNDRGNAQSVQKHMRSLRKWGNVHGVRGAPYAVASAEVKAPYHLITYGTVAKAFYKAEKAWAAEPNIAASRTHGLDNITILDPAMPADAIRWLVNFANEFNEGDSLTLCQVYDEFGSVNAQWKAHSDLTGVSARNGAGEQSAIALCG